MYITVILYFFKMKVSEVDNIAMQGDNTLFRRIHYIQLFNVNSFKLKQFKINIFYLNLYLYIPVIAKHNFQQPLLPFF